MRDLFGRHLPLPLLDRRNAPHWNGETAEQILAERLEERKRKAAEKAANRRSGRRSSSSPKKPPLEGPAALIKRLRRLERNLPRRKTLAARIRLEAEITELRKELSK